MKVKFSVSTRYVGSKVEEVLYIDLSDCETEEEIEEVLSKEYEFWVWENIDGGFEIL